MRIVTFSTLFPHVAHPTHGLFVEQRLRHLLTTGAVESRVVAPLPWFPVTHPRINKYAWLARDVPEIERRHGLEIHHPRYLLIPKMGMTTAPFTLAAALLRGARRLIDEGFDFDLIDAHYFYPDGVAAVLAARRLGKPVVITARGSDLNQIPQYAIPRRMIRWAAVHADGLITVCQALKRVLLEMGVEDHRVRVLRNGVDLQRFRPRDRTRARQQLQLTRPTLLSVGFLIDRKGHDLIIRAMRDLPEMELLIVGDGPRRQALHALPEVLGVADRVRFIGEVSQERLPLYYSAADLLVLASDREGWANVLLESMACGTPVAATNVWGTPESVTCHAAGVLIEERSPEGIVRAVKRALADPPERTASRHHAEGFSWDQTSRGQLELFREILAREKKG